MRVYFRRIFYVFFKNLTTSNFYFEIGMLMVVDVFFRKNTRTFLWDQIRRTFWRKFHVFNNPAINKN